MTIDTNRMRRCAAANGIQKDVLRNSLLDAADTMDAQAAEIKRLRGLVAELADHDTYETEYDGRMYTICNDCGAKDNAKHSPSCVYIRARAALQGEAHGN